MKKNFWILSFLWKIIIFMWNFAFPDKNLEDFLDEPSTVKREIAWEHDGFMVVHPDGDDQTT